MSVVNDSRTPDGRERATPLPTHPRGVQWTELSCTSRAYRCQLTMAPSSNITAKDALWACPSLTAPFARHLRGRSSLSARTRGIREFALVFVLNLAARPTRGLGTVN